MSATMPKRLTGQIARVRGVMAASIRPASIRYVSGSMSTKTGEAPVKRIELTVALKVCETVMTSSPGPRPRPAKIDIRATVPFDMAMACLTPQKRGPALLELRDLAAPGDHAAVEDFGDGGDLLWAEVRAGGRDHAMAPVLVAGRSASEPLVGVEGEAAPASRAGEGGARRGVRSGAGARRVGQPLAAGADPAQAAGRIAGDERVVGHVAGHDRPRADGRESADRGAGDDHRAGADGAAVTELDRADGPVVAAGQLAGRGDGPRVSVVGEDRVRAR